MNRAARRAAEKAAKSTKKSKPLKWGKKRFKDEQEAIDHIFKPISLLYDCRPIEEHETTNDFLRIRLAFEALKDGSAQSSDYTMLVRAILIAGVRAVDIDDRLVPPIEAAMAALTRCGERFDKHGSYGFDGPGMLDVAEALDINEEIVLNSTRQQLIKASAAAKASWERAVAKRFPSLASS